MNKPFWEETYRVDDISAFGMEPNQTIYERYSTFTKNGTVLDVGCGEGKNAIFLAQKGFKVDAFDVSKFGIEKLKRFAHKNNVKVNAWVQDLCAYEFAKVYNVITSHGTLHFVTKEQWKAFLCQAKKYTLTGGSHIIQIFTNKIPRRSMS